MKYKLLSFALIPFFVGCGADSENPNGENTISAGKADQFNSGSSLVVSGARNEVIELDAPFQCDMGQFFTLGGWHNEDNSSFDFPTFRLTMAHGTGKVASGDVIESVTSSNRLIFDGSGFSSQGSAQCDLVIDEYVNEGRGGKAGIAISFQDCQLLKGEEAILLSGEISCLGEGYNAIDIPDDNPDDQPDDDPVDEPDDDPVDEPTDETCDLAEYSGWLSTLQELATKNRVDQDALQGHVDGLPCRPISAAPYAEWIEVFNATVVAVGSTIDSTDQSTLSKVVAGAPAATDVESYQLWFNAFDTQFKKLAPSNSASIDNTDAAILATYYPARPAAKTTEAYEVWYPLYAQRMEGFLPSSSATLDNDERSQIDALISAQPRVNTDGAWLLWFQTYKRFFDMTLPSNSAFIDNDEQAILHALIEHAPMATEGEAFVEWTALFRVALERTGSSIDNNETRVISEVIRIKPCGESAEATEAFTTLETEFADHAGAEFIPAADPSACN